MNDVESGSLLHSLPIQAGCHSKGSSSLQGKFELLQRPNRARSDEQVGGSKLLLQIPDRLQCTSAVQRDLQDRYSVRDQCLRNSP